MESKKTAEKLEDVHSINFNYNSPWIDNSPFDDPVLLHYNFHTSRKDLSKYRQTRFVNPSSFSCEVLGRKRQGQEVQ